MPVATPTLTERFATILRCLCLAVAGCSSVGRVSVPLTALIVGRLSGISQCVARLAARIGAGRYAPRRCTSRCPPPAGSRPRPPSLLPKKFGWLLPLVPEAVGYRAQLEHLLRNPEMAALLAAAPAPLGRPLRSLCWMLRIEPPAILAPPARPRPPREKKPSVAKQAAPPRPPLAKPWWWVEPPRRTGWSFGRSRSPPRSG